MAATTLDPTSDLSYFCYRCKAKPTEPCRTPKGTVMKFMGVHRSRIDQRRAWVGANAVVKNEERLAEVISWARDLMGEWTEHQRAAMYTVLILDFAGVDMDEVWKDTSSLDQARLRLRQLFPKQPAQNAG